jgi:hypothetical protein
MSKNRSGSLTPFIFSRRYKYFLLAFLALAIVGPFLDNSFGLDFQSYPNITLGLGFPLTILFYLWISIDTMIWLMKRPDQFLGFSISRSKWKGPFRNFFSKKPIAFSLYIITSVLFFICGIFLLVLLISSFLSLLVHGTL